jgi:hypothetical protein
MKISFQVRPVTICTWGWGAAFLIVLLISANDLCRLQNRPLVGLSGETRMVKLKLTLLENTVLQSSQALATDMNLLLANYMPVRPSDSNLQIQEDQEEGGSHREPIQLPTLTGVLQRLDHRGQQSYTAVFNNRLCRINDHIDGFRVSLISPQGVELMRAGRRWHLACPTAHYSMDIGK